jgi:hypothetical protein
MRVQQTTRQRANTKYALEVMWPAIKPENVSGCLQMWRTVCGTAACFGGHCAVDPQFMKQGVYESGGVPTHVDYDTPAAIAWMLFGDRNMFGPRGQFPYLREDALALTDHKLVTRRLEWLLDNSIVKDTIHEPQTQW